MTNDNLLLLRERVTAFNNRPGPRVGDYLRLPELHPKLGKFTRLTHDWGDTLQTGGLDGSYYFSRNGFLNYSGSLDSGLPVLDIRPEASDVKPGRVWFFDGDISGAGRGVYFDVLMRVFDLRDGARLDGIGELRCPYSVIVLDQAGHERTCDYWYLVQKDGMACTAFNREEQLMTWLPANGLKLTKPLTPAGEHSWQNLAYA